MGLLAGIKFSADSASPPMDLSNEPEYETFLEILRDAGEAWGSGQAGMGARRATPFHVLFAASEREKTKRAHWGMEEIDTEPTREPGTRRRTPSKRT